MFALLWWLWHFPHFLNRQVDILFEIPFQQKKNLTKRTTGSWPMAIMVSLWVYLWTLQPPSLWTITKPVFLPYLCCFWTICLRVFCFLILVTATSLVGVLNYFPRLVKESYSTFTACALWICKLLANIQLWFPHWGHQSIWIPALLLHGAYPTSNQPEIHCCGLQTTHFMTLVLQVLNIW